MSTKNFVSVRLMKEKNVLKKLIKNFREWLKLTERFFNAVWRILKEYLKIPDKADEYNRDFKENLRKLENEKSNLLKVNGISDDYNKYKYKCENCSDTGYDKKR